MSGLCSSSKLPSSVSSSTSRSASGVFAGFAAGWIVQENMIEETPDSNRFGYISDVCVLPAFRGRHIAALLLEAQEARLSLGGVKRIRLSALAANRAS